MSIVSQSQIAKVNDQIVSIIFNECQSTQSSSNQPCRMFVTVSLSEWC